MQPKNKKSLLRTLFLRKRRKGESFFKYAMGLFHLWLGLLSSVVICIVCLTGCIYAFKKQIIDVYNYDKVFVNPSEKSIDVAEIQQYFSSQNKEIKSLFIPESKKRSWVVSYTDEAKNTISTYFDPYQRKELGIGDNALDGFFQDVLGLHRNLLLGEVGRQIVGASVLIFVLLLFSGLILWIPKKIKHLKQSLTIKWSAKPQRVNYDLHRTLGVYSLPFLLIIAITGLYITYPWVKNSLIVGLGGTSIYEEKAGQEAEDDFAKLMEDMLARQEEKEIQDVENISLVEVLNEVQKHLNYEGNTTMTMPSAENPRYHIIKINAENWLGALLPDEISLDRQGNLKSKDLFWEKSLDKQFTAIVSPLHTGAIMGLPSIIFYFILSLIGFLLPITGFLIWWNRVKKQI